MINSKLYIKSWCQITNKEILLSGSQILANSSDNINSWLNDIYRNNNIQYLKFFKMDNLSKAGFLALELMFKEQNMPVEQKKYNCSVVGFNKSSSLESDKNYQKTIENIDNYFPSPALFVYTLANIVTGEIAIRHSILGETSFYISENFSSTDIFYNFANVFKKNANMEIVVGGWIEYEGSNCDVKVLMVSKEKNNIEFTENNIINLYK